MDYILNQIKKDIYDKCSLEISDFKTQIESKDYDACQFKLNGLNVLCRNAKITPKKTGQFVTFWKRNGNGPIEPYHESDEICFFLVNVQTENSLGQFVFPKEVLVKKRIISTDNREGKRAFRVYPKWNTTKSKQATITQEWQLDYFYEIAEDINLENVRKLYRYSKEKN